MSIKIVTALLATALVATAASASTAPVRQAPVVSKAPPSSAQLLELIQRLQGLRPELIQRPETGPPVPILFEEEEEEALMRLFEDDANEEQYLHFFAPEDN